LLNQIEREREREREREDNNLINDSLKTRLITKKERNLLVKKE